MKQFLKSFKDQRIVTRAICLYRLQTTECAHTVQVSRLWSEVVGETWQGVAGVAVLESSLFVMLEETNLVSEYEASTGRLQQRAPCGGVEETPGHGRQHSTRTAGHL